MVRYDNNLADIVENLSKKIQESKINKESKLTEIANLILSFSFSDYTFYIYKGRLYDISRKSYPLSEFNITKKDKYWSKEEIDKISEKYEEKRRKKKKRKKVIKWNKKLEELKRLYSPW